MDKCLEDKTLTDECTDMRMSRRLIALQHTNIQRNIYNKRYSQHLTNEECTEKCQEDKIFTLQM